jgi:hypothetical protein
MAAAGGEMVLTIPVACMNAYTIEASDPDLGMQDLISLRIHGVDSRYSRGMRRGN